MSHSFVLKPWKSLACKQNMIHRFIFIVNRKAWYSIWFALSKHHQNRAAAKTAALKQALQSYSSSPLVLRFFTFVLIHTTDFICIYQKFHSSIMEILGNYYLAFPSFKSFSPFTDGQKLFRMRLAFPMRAWYFARWVHTGNQFWNKQKHLPRTR